MAELKTKPNLISVESYLNNTITDPVRKNDCKTIIEIMQKATGEPAVMWGTSIVGFGKIHYKYASGHEGDTMVCGFSSRKSALTIYGIPGLDRFKETLSKLGKYKTGKGCLYIKTLADVDIHILAELITKSNEKMKSNGKTRKYTCFRRS
jgi:hypothetical protein